ncbi:MAG TPA: thiol:disulfide interchange protein DsbA/DsbL [Novimethylophilus sp.]|jgi:thiol:disulfide interchange protein DsbA|uniref:thiol:disulfide interchange protein DsbA/DsbL n=1 Tax=Novimethylophilus sp. TaxID=2137426 RepID=UPI002F40E1A6
MKSFIAAFLMLLATTACAEPQPGIDFMQTQQAIPTDNPAKIEIVELFWYGCPHCYQLEPTLAVWVKKLPKDVEFKRVPGIARPDWAPMAKAYYAMEMLGVAEKLHVALFDAVHKQRALRPDNDAAIIDWITKQGGLDRKKVEETYNSFSVNTKVMRAAQMFRASGATGVPSLIVEGRYLTSSTLAGGNEEALKVVEYLIDRVRQEKTQKR